jgi:hypothetical protein
MQQAPIVGLSQVLSQSQLSHNLAFPMTTWQLSLNLALDPCLDTPIKDTLKKIKDTCIRSIHTILTEIYDIPCLLWLIFFPKIFAVIGFFVIR